MKIGNDSARKVRQPSVTDIMNEPIAEGGLRSRFELTTDAIFVGAARHPSQYVIAEALGTCEQIALLACVAEHIGAANVGAVSNVFDFRTGRQLPAGRQLKWEIISDAAPDRYATGFAILEVSGPRAQIERLSVEAARVFA